jgi:hypothetical protein
MQRPQQLGDLYPPGTPLAEVNPDFRGMDRKLWQRLKVFGQGEAHRKTLNPEDAPISKKAVWTPRDDYGLKGV